MVDIMPNQKYKLKLSKFVPPQKKYPSPIGWWKVTTEGDVEGRSETNLGEHCGHLAEIAFSLADKSSYSLRFSPIENRKLEKRKTLTPTGNTVNVYANIGFGNDSLSEADFAIFLNTDDIEIKVGGYYNTISLTLKG